MDKKKKWLKKVKNREEEYTVDLMEMLFSNLDLYSFVLSCYLSFILLLGYLWGWAMNAGRGGG